MTGNSNYIAELQFGAPKIDEEAFVAPTAVVVGAVTLGSRTSIWYGAVARADERALQRMAPSIIALAYHEGFPAHGNAIRRRLD